MSIKNTGKTFRKSFNISLASIVVILGRPNTKASIDAICEAEGLPCVDEWDTYCEVPTPDSRRALRFGFWLRGKRGWATVTFPAVADGGCIADVAAFTSGRGEPSPVRFF